MSNSTTIRLLATSGRGPAECRIALRHALGALAREAQAAGLDCDIAEGAGSDRHGPASAIVVLAGAGAADFARNWTGSILWIAPSPVRPNHKRKNWYVGIAAMPAPAALPSAVTASDVRFETLRAGGPGGQHQNKTESAVRAIHVPTGLAVVARNGRSQHRNKSAALERLGELLRLSADLHQRGEQALIHAGHDTLERGNPIRRFTGPKFEPA